MEIPDKLFSNLLPIFSPGEEREAFNQLRRATGEDQKKLCEEIFLRNLRLVYQLAQRHYPQAVADAFGYGCLGLKRAIDCFDPSRGFKFSTFAINWIKRKMMKGIIDGGLVRYPPDVLQSRKKLTQLAEHLGVTPDQLTTAQAIDHLGCCPSAADRYLAPRLVLVGLDTPLGFEDGSNSLADQIAAPVVDPLQTTQEHPELGLAWNRLGADEQEVLWRLIIRREPRQVVAQAMMLTAREVSCINRRARHKLRTDLVALNPSLAV